MDECAQFEVTKHYELRERGAFVIGHIREGDIRIGMQVLTEAEPPTLTICGVESVDNVSEKKYWNALLFSEKPSMEFIKNVFPKGSTLNIINSNETAS